MRLVVPVPEKEIETSLRSVRKQCSVIVVLNWKFGPSGLNTGSQNDLQPCSWAQSKQSLSKAKLKNFGDGA